MKALTAYFKRHLSEPVHRVPGGIKPPGFKEHTLVSPIMPMPLPDQLALCLTQQDGLELQVEVEIGQDIHKNQLIASPRTRFGVPVFAPTSGRVCAIEPRLIASEFEQWQPHAIIEVDGKNTVASNHKLNQLEKLSPEQLRHELQQLGVSGLGGADFPTTIKLKKASTLNSELLIINAAECEPFITADEALIRQKAEQVLVGATVLQKAAEAKQCVIAIEENKTDAIASLKAALSGSTVKLALLTTKYPAGGEKQIIQAVTGKEVPSGSLPAHIGILVQNVGTAYAAYDAIINGQPCISRITSLAGTPLTTPKNFEALLGTPIPFLLNLCGLDKTSHESTLMGGSLMGAALFSDQVAVSRATNCIIATSTQWFPEPSPEMQCIRCGFCADACPISLLPQQLVAFSKSKDAEQLIDHKLNDCIECGACSYVCPSKIPLVEYFRAGKSLLNEEDEQSKLSQHWQERYQYHQYRTKKLKEETLERKRKLRDDRAQETASKGFSRAKAKADIAAAVSRVKKRKTGAKNTNQQETKSQGK